jgi:hypothetical protein
MKASIAIIVASLAVLGGLATGAVLLVLRILEIADKAVS